MSKESVHRYARTDMSARRRGWFERLIILILNFCVTNLFHFVLWKASTQVDPHYFDVWQAAHHDISISFYSYTIFVAFILNLIFCRNDI
jgi:hypothetical protein